MIEHQPKPELLTKLKKYSQMEMEMDKFLAKKSQIYSKIIFQNQFIDQGNSSRSDQQTKENNSD